MASANNIRIIISAKDQASTPLKKTQSEVEGLSGSSKRLGSVLKTGLKVGFAATAAGASLATAGLVKAAKASYDQVKAVEEARFGLLAYEKDGRKVNKVLDGLVAYAKSDMGVLFNRKDMFAAASTLKMYGNSTDTLTERVKILSKGVAQGKTTFQELSQIVGRAAAKGRLDAVDFDMLIERGIGLDRKFRGAKVSSEELWKALNKALPDKLLEGRANTIEGRMIRLQSAFRGVGDAVLGVDAKTNNFIEGGLGDRIQKGITRTTDFLRGAAPVVSRAINGIMASFDVLSTGTLKDGIFANAVGKDSEYVGVLKRIHATFRSAFDYLSPKVIELGDSFKQNLLPVLKDLWDGPGKEIAKLVGGVLVASFAAWKVQTGLLVGALSGGMRVFKQVWDSIKPVRDILSEVYRQVLRPIWSFIANNFKQAWNDLVATFSTFTNNLHPLEKPLKAIGAVLLLIAGAPIVLLVGGLTLLIGTLSLLAKGVAWASRKLQEFVQWVQQNFRKSWDAAASAWRSAGSYFSQKWQQIKNAFGSVRNWFSSTFHAGVNALKAPFNSVGAWAGGVWARIRNAFRPSTMASVGKAMIRALWNGVTSMVGWFRDRFTSWASSLMDGIKSALGGGKAKKRNAVGTNHFATTTESVVGEHGPEVVRLPAGSSVTPTYRSRRELVQPQGRSVVVNIGSYNSYNERDDKRFFSNLGFALENAS